MSSEELTVAGYARDYCPYIVPAVVVRIIESFFTLWIHHQLSDRELHRLRIWSKFHLTQRSDEIEIHNLKINGTQIRMTSYYSLSTENETQMVCRIWKPAGVNYIAGYFGGSDWKRLFFKKSTKQTMKKLILNDAAYPILRLPLVSTYFDIHQIKYHDDVKKEDFDATPSLNTKGRFQWMIGCDHFMSGDSNDVLLSQTECGWKGSLLCKDGELHMRCNEPFLPIDVRGYEMKVTINYVHERQSGTQEVWITENRTSTLGWSRKEIDGSTLMLDAAFEVTAFIDLEGDKQFLDPSWEGIGL